MFPNCRLFSPCFITNLWSWPPEADRKADLQGSDVVPVFDRDEQHVSWLQNTFQIRSFGKLREKLSVGILHLHLQRRRSDSAGLNMRSLGPLSSPDWCCEEAATDAGRACPCRLGNTDGCICFLPPGIYRKIKPMCWLLQKGDGLTWARKFCWGSWCSGDTVPAGPNHAFIVMSSSSPSPRQQ